MLQVFCLEYLDPDEGHETGYFIDWPLEAERTGYLSDGYAVMDCLFSTQLFDSQLMADDGQDKLEEGHIIMPRLRPSKQPPGGGTRIKTEVYRSKL